MDNFTSPDQIRSIFKLSFQEPTLGERKLGKRLGLSHSTIGKYKKIAKEANCSAEIVMQMDDEDLKQLFNLQSRKANFIEPDWDEIRKYLQTKGHWGQMLPTIKSAWEFLYLKKMIPDYVTGDLPEGIMSERTFCRRYAEYLHCNGLDQLKHQANPNNNFGPGSVVEIDTIGDRLTYLDANNQEQQAVIFSAVLKYSGLLYAEAMPSGSGICWASAIIHALYAFGGVPEVIRCDNDAALVIHGNQKNRTRFRASIEFTVKEFDLVTDLCPPRKPEWKGRNERANGFAQKHFFEGSDYSKTIHAANLEALNELIKAETFRINSMSRNHGQLSSLEVFNRYESSCLKALPLFQPVVHYISYAVVRKDAYVNYQRNYYYAGKENIGKTILIENKMGKQIYLRHDKTLVGIVEYELDKNSIPPGNHHKAEKFKTEIEKITSRPREWFIEEFSKLKGPTENILHLIDWVYESTSQSKQVATRICNSIYRLYDKFPNNLECLDIACRDVLQRKNKVDIVGQLTVAYGTYCRVKLFGPNFFENLKYEGNSADIDRCKSEVLSRNNDNEDSVRGEEYFDDVF